MGESNDETPGIQGLEGPLARAFDGFEILERELEFPSGERTVRAAAAGLDSAGRLWFVVRVGLDPERALMDALELLSLAGEDGGALLRDLGSHAGPDVRRLAPDRARVSPDDVRVALVADHADERLARRVAAIDTIELFELSRWRGSHGERTQLVARRGTTPARPPTRDEFLRRLDDDARALAELALARMQRLDANLELAITHDGIAWRRDETELARLRIDRGVLTARAGRIGSELPITCTGDIEAWTAEVLALALEQDEDDLGPLPDGESVTRMESSGPLLTAEELAAFRD